MIPVRFLTSLAQAYVHAGEAAAATAVTLAVRLPLFAGALVSPSAAAAAEWQRACSEKAAASAEGLAAASEAWARILLGLAQRPPTPLGLATDLMRLGAVASRPARHRVTANAKRLGTRR